MLENTVKMIKSDYENLVFLFVYKHPEFIFSFQGDIFIYASVCTLSACTDEPKEKLKFRTKPSPTNFFPCFAPDRLGINDFKTNLYSCLHIINIFLIFADDLIFYILFKQPIQYWLLSAIFHKKNIIL